MDWQIAELNPAWRYAFMALVRGLAEFADPAAIRASVDAWNRQMGILDAHLAATGAFVAGEGFTLADIVLGLSAHRWCMTPMHRPALPALQAWYARLQHRPAWRAYCTEEFP
jgi:glutathione S-transferase